MIEIRRSKDRGHRDHGWLRTSHSFSFADYYDPEYMGFSVLRVINDDTVQPKRGFGMHGHNDMEIVTYVLQGELQHQDSLGNGSVIRPGDVQRMSAGTGIRHSEFNPSETEAVHLLQIWLLPAKNGMAPSYEQKAFSDDEKRGKLRLIASPDGAESSVTIGQDVRLYAALLDGEERTSHTVAQGRSAYVQVAAGSLSLNDMLLNAGDGARITEATELMFHTGHLAEVLLFDLPA
jgi:redox-sensitive bicupin YhaK (pirin superfamily)